VPEEEPAQEEGIDKLVEIDEGEGESGDEGDGDSA
jgi:hypothetical protein